MTGVQETCRITSALLHCVDFYFATFSFYFRSPVQWIADTKSLVKTKNTGKGSTLPWIFLSFVWLPLSGLGSSCFLCFRKFYYQDPNIKNAQAFTLVTFSVTILWSICLGYFVAVRWIDDGIHYFNSIISFLMQLQECK